MKDPDWPGGKAAVDYYFIQDDGGMFKCTYFYEPYFYIACTVSPYTVLKVSPLNLTHALEWNGNYHRGMAH